jgi:hypothetical protein
LLRRKLPVASVNVTRVVPLIETRAFSRYSPVTAFFTRPSMVPGAAAVCAGSEAGERRAVSATVSTCLRILKKPGTDGAPVRSGANRLEESMDGFIRGGGQVEAAAGGRRAAVGRNRPSHRTIRIALPDKSSRMVIWLNTRAV